jgi:hypothetical protein
VLWPLADDVTTRFLALAAACLIFVFVVFAALLVRLMRRRREMHAITCPENRRPALVVVQRSPDVGDDAVVDCSRWHDGKRDCSQRCLERAS